MRCLWWSSDSEACYPDDQDRPRAGYGHGGQDNLGSRSYALASPEAFRVISRAWLRCGWDNKYVYSFTWLGRPVIQLPEDLIRIQEVIYRIKPDVIIETGVAHGGSLVFFASLCHAIGRGRVIGVDIEIRPHNRQAIEAHELFPLITLIEGSSIEKSVISRVKMLVKPGEKTVVVLDSNHTKGHVLNELRAYADLISQDSYIIATDGIMADLVGAPRSNADWSWNNPKRRRPSSSRKIRIFAWKSRSSFLTKEQSSRG